MALGKLPLFTDEEPARLEDQILPEADHTLTDTTGIALPFLLGN